MTLVLDTSATLAWIYPDELTNTISEVAHQIYVSGAWVPSHWPLEIANALQMSVRRGRYDTEFRDNALVSLTKLSIKIDQETNDHVWKSTLALADKHRLTLYDAAYLELALRRGLPLASLDKDLCKAAKAENVTIIGK